jgi:hypothetical protein
VTSLQIREQLGRRPRLELVGGLSGKRATSNDADHTGHTERDDPPEQPVAREHCANTHNEKNARCAL